MGHEAGCVHESTTAAMIVGQTSWSEAGATEVTGWLRVFTVATWAPSSW
jgi:hypothetical protein